VFQSYAIWPHMTVFDNVALPLTDGVQRIPRKEVAARVHQALELVELDQLAQRPATLLSGGQQQRVALARAIAVNSKLLLMDEPLSNLDARLREDVRGRIRDLAKELGSTVLYVTHDQVEAMAMGDRVMVLHQGFVRQIGTPKEVYDDPEDTFVATFLGSPPMNLVENGEIIVGFRPEALIPIELVPNPAIRLRLKVGNIEYLGSEWIIYGQVVEGRFNGKEVISRLTSARSFQLDQTYDFGVREEDLKFFDKQTEKRAQARALAWQ